MRKINYSVFQKKFFCPFSFFFYIPVTAFWWRNMATLGRGEVLVDEYDRRRIVEMYL